MTTLREAAQQALEALESCQDGDYTTGDVRQSFDEQAVNAAIVALWAALAEPVQRNALLAQRDALLEALKLALSSHGVMLTSDPPQEAWKAHRVEAKARAAIAAAEGGKTWDTFRQT